MMNIKPWAFALLVVMAGCQVERPAAPSLAEKDWQKETSLGQPKGLWVQDDHVVTVDANGNLVSG